MKIKTIVALLLVLSFVTACAQATPTASYPPPVPILATPTAISYPPPPVPPTQAVPATPTAAAQPTAAEQAAIQEVSTKYNIPADQIKILSTQPMTWNNGCMGVVLPGVLCTNVIVNGFIVRLESNGQQFEIHSNQDGTSVLDAAQLEATLNFVVSSPSQTIQVVPSNIPLGPTFNPAFTGLPPLGGSVAGTAYFYNSTTSSVVSANTSSQQMLSFIQNPTYGLAIWHGGAGAQPRLAWGTQPTGTDRATSLMIANPDGSNIQTLLTISPNTDSPVQLVAEFWSADGETVYFSKEPVGIGGYIPFSGFSNLYAISIGNKQVTDIIPQAASTAPNPCLDAITGDYNFVADHCVQGVITVRDLQAGSTSTIQLPAGFSGARLLGSARFSPSGDRVAFAMAKGNPDDEMGWLAVGSRAGGTAQIIATSDKGNYYNVIGWLDEQTLLVQKYSVGSPTGANQVITVSTDGTVITTLVEGTLLTVIDNR